MGVIAFVCRVELGRKPKPRVMARRFFETEEEGRAWTEEQRQGGKFIEGRGHYIGWHVEAEDDRLHNRVLESIVLTYLRTRGHVPA